MFDDDTGDDKTSLRSAKLRNASAKALRDAGSDYRTARSILRIAALTDTPLRDAILEHGVSAAIRDAGHDQRQRVRAAIISDARAKGRASVDLREIAASCRAEEAANFRGVFLITLPGGIHLGTATFADIESARIALQKQRAGVEKSISFYTIIMQRCGKDQHKLVRDAWKEKELDEQFKIIYAKRPKRPVKDT